MHRSNRFLSLIILTAALLALTACGGQPTATATPTPRLPTAIPLSPTPLVRLDATATPLPAGPQETRYGPDNFPANVDPLTGLTVDDPSVLDRAPLLVKVSNETEDVRPQSGLSYADHVWMYQMEGWGQTRFTAVFYSRAPEFAGPVRSVRLIDTDNLLPMYDGLIVMSGCSVGMCTIIKYAPWIQRVFTDDGLGYLVRKPGVPHDYTRGWETLYALPDQLWQAADKRQVNNKADLTGLVFDSTPPAGGTATTEMAIDYPGKGTKQTWRYDAASARWLSSQEMQNAADPQESADTDYLTGQQLAFDNVVIVYAEFYLANFIEDQTNQLLSIGPILTGSGAAVLLRDGQRYDITWKRDDPEKLLQFYGADGNLIAFKPGTTWFNVASVRQDQYPPAVTFSP